MDTFIFLGKRVFRGILNNTTTESEPLTLSILPRRNSGQLLQFSFEPLPGAFVETFSGFITEDESNPNEIRVLGSGVLTIDGFTRDEFIAEPGITISPIRDTITGDFDGNPDTTEIVTFPNAIFLEAEDINLDGFDDLVTVERVDGQLAVSIYFNQPDIPLAVDDNVEITTNPQNLALANIDVLANDRDLQNDLLSITSFTQPANGSVSRSDVVSDRLIYIANPGFTGTDTFEYTITDGDGDKDSGQVTVNVLPPTGLNNAPSAVFDEVTVTRDNTVDIDVLANDSDPEGDPLSVNSDFAQPDNGSLVLEDNVFSYTPNPGFTGEDAFGYSISTPDGQSANTFVEINVVAPDQSVSPDAVDDVFDNVDPENSTFLDVLNNDSDPNGDPIDIVSFTQPNNGSVTQNGEGLLYVPDSNFSGTETFSYTIDDGNGNRDSAQVEINGILAQDDFFNTLLDKSTELDVLANDGIPQNNPPNIISFTQPNNGSLSRSDASDKLIYTSNPGFFGTDTFEYTVAISNGGQDSARVTVDVSSTNNPPKAVSNFSILPPDTTIVIDVLANDSDPDGDPLTISDFGPLKVNSGSLVFNNNQFIYTPNPSFTGEDTFSYSISTPDGQSANTFVDLLVLPRDSSTPIAVEDVFNNVESENSTFLDVLNNDSGPIGDLSIIGFTQPDNGSVIRDGEGLLYIPDPNFSGTETFIYTINNDIGLVDTAEVTINTSTNLVAQDDFFTTFRDTSIELDVFANDRDPEGGTFFINGFGNPANGTLIQNGNLFDYTPNPGFIGTDTFGYAISNEEGKFNAALVTVTVEECFLTGTRILTESGYKKVEELAMGDMVQTAEGKLEPVKWIGYQNRQPNQIENPLRGYPILLKAGCLGNGLPVRDLYTSPDHAMLVEGLLINAGALVNDVSIIKTEPTEAFCYWHIELEHHSLLIAEGTPAESFYPNHEDRLAYDNGREYDRLYPDGNSQLMLYPMDYPRVSSKNKVPRYVRQKLMAIAEELNPSKVLATV